MKHLILYFTPAYYLSTKAVVPNLVLIKAASVAISLPTDLHF